MLFHPVAHNPARQAEAVRAETGPSCATPGGRRSLPTRSSVEGSPSLPVTPSSADVARELAPRRREPGRRIRVEPRWSTRPTCARCCRPCGCRRSCSTAPGTPSRLAGRGRPDPGRQGDPRLGHRLLHANLALGRGSRGGRAVRRGRARSPKVPDTRARHRALHRHRRARRERAAELGDRAWRELLEQHHSARAPGARPLSRRGEGHCRRRVLRDLRRAGARDPLCARDRRRASASSGSRFGRACTRASARCTRARSRASPW